MKDVSKTDWFAIALSALGIFLSAFGDGEISKFGGLLTLLAIAVAVYGFVSRARALKQRDMEGSHE